MKARGKWVLLELGAVTGVTLELPDSFKKEMHEGASFIVVSVGEAVEDIKANDQVLIVGIPSAFERDGRKLMLVDEQQVAIILD